MKILIRDNTQASTVKRSKTASIKALFHRANEIDSSKQAF